MSLDHKWTFEGHQLGVVSVVADPAGNSECANGGLFSSHTTQLDIIGGHH